MNRVFKLGVLISILSSSLWAQVVYRNPVNLNNNRTCPDPGILNHRTADGLFFMACGGGRFQMFKSEDLVNWTSYGRILENQMASWGVHQEGWQKRDWSPYLFKMGDRYMAYYNQNTSGGFGGIGLSETQNILGVHFNESRSTPLLKADSYGGVIGGSYFKDPATNKSYFLYKVDGNAIGIPTEIKIRELNSDGRSVKSGFVPRVLLRGGTKLHDLYEGQELIKRGQYYYIFYSYGSFTSNYRVHVSRSKNLFGPYEGNRLILQAKPGGKFYAPGSGTITQIYNKHYFFYHAKDKSREVSEEDKKNRWAMIDRIYWQDGWPIIHDGFPSEDPQYLPVSWRSNFPTVLLKWDTVGMNNPKFSFGVKSKTGEYISGCINADILQNKKSLLFDGNCISRGQKIELDSKAQFQVCAGEYGSFTAANRVCTSFTKFNKEEISFNLVKKTTFPQVNLKWNTYGIKNPKFSFRVVDGEGRVIERCLDAGVLGNKTSYIFDGNCISRGQRISITSDSKFKICAGEEGQFTSSTMTCSPYTKFSADAMKIELVKSFPKVSLNWRSFGIADPAFSLRVVDEDGKVYGQCVNAGVIKGNTSLEFDGLCVSRNERIKLNDKAKFMICAGPKGSFAPHTMKCSPYIDFSTDKINFTLFDGGTSY